MVAHHQQSLRKLLKNRKHISNRIQPTLPKDLGMAVRKISTWDSFSGLLDYGHNNHLLNHTTQQEQVTRVGSACTVNRRPTIINEESVLVLVGSYLPRKIKVTRSQPLLWTQLDLSVKRKRSNFPSSSPFPKSQLQAPDRHFHCHLLPAWSVACFRLHAACLHHYCKVDNDYSLVQMSYHRHYHHRCYRIFPLSIADRHRKTSPLRRCVSKPIE